MGLIDAQNLDDVLAKMVLTNPLEGERFSGWDIRNRNTVSTQPKKTLKSFETELELRRTSILESQGKT